ncbi:MAG: STAS domain-containing protein [Egibacteraceae bacterium]
MAACEPSPTTPASARRPGPRPIALVIHDPIPRADIPLLCERVRVLLEGSGAAAVLCDVGGLDDPDAGTIDALARLQLTARRLGRQIRLRYASRELQELLALTGLRDVVPLCGLSVEPGQQSEQREQPCGVEERVDPGDPTG